MDGTLRLPSGRSASGGSPKSLRPVASIGLRQEIVAILREAIWTGVIRPGERLGEVWLAEQLGVSRPPLREAIRVLEQEGLVTSIPRRGSFVRTLSGHDISEIYACRFALEGMAAELVMDLESPNLDALERLLVPVERGDVGDLVERVNRDLEFHRTLMHLSQNARLAGMWEQIAGQIRLALTLVDPEFFHSDFVGATHGALVMAIRRRDRAEAQRLTRSLLDVGEDLSRRWDEEVGNDAQQAVGAFSNRGAVRRGQ